MKPRQSLLGRLQTLKLEPHREQVRCIELLVEQNLDLFDDLQLLLRGERDDSISEVALSTDRAKVVRVALLGVIAADIATVPDAHSRGVYIERLTAVCQHFDVDYKDVAAIVAHAGAIEEILESEGL